MSHPIPAVALSTEHSGKSAAVNALGMRPMQERAWNRRGEQYLLIKSPPASGKSRALMFIALDKLHHQGVKQAIIAVPEKSIGASFHDAPLAAHGFFTDWQVRPRWNLCDAPGDDERADRSKVKAVGEFLRSDDRILVCTHATFRFAVEEYGIDAFDGRLLAIDEFHHVSADADNRLGSQLRALIARDKAHITAMTGSYFRGDAVPVLTPDDEAKFATVTYTYYEQLNGYAHLKELRIGYYFYTGRYLDAIRDCLDPGRKTIVHIPSVNARESTKDKVREVNEIMDALGTWQGMDEQTGFHMVETPDGRVLKIADLVDDSEPAKRARVLAALKDPAANQNRDHVDIIIALGMAKEGFDWIWCEHALTVGYRSSLTEIVQIIGRATRDAPGKTAASFTNLIAEPDASETAVAEAINDTLKAIAASLLMEQVLAPRFEFVPKGGGAVEGVDYGEGGYQPGATNIGVHEESGQYVIEVAGLVQPKSPEATRICQQDLNELVASFVQDPAISARGMFDPEVVPEELTVMAMGRIVRERYPDLDSEDQEAVRQHAVAAMNLIQKGKEETLKRAVAAADGEARGSTALIDGIRQFVTDVRELDIDLIDRINPFEAAYAVLAKAMREETLYQVQAAIAARRTTLTPETAAEYAQRAAGFRKERGRLPSFTASDSWERQLAEGAAAFMRFRAEGRYERN